MKIAFLGSHGVGKTTLCFDTASRIKRLDMGVDLVKEVARACPLPINRDTTLEAQGSVLDNYAYLVHQVGRRSAYDELVRTWIRSYDGLFKVPVLQAPSFDGTRDVSGTFQGEIDAVINDLLDAFEVPCERLDPGDRDGWVDAVLRGAGLPLSPPQIDIFPVEGAG